MINSDFLPHMPTVIQILKDHNVKSAYLFGSVLTDRFNKDSDVDILVELDYSKPVGLEFVQMQLDLQSLLRKPIDLVSNRGLSKYIRPYIEADKILLYEC